MDFVMHLPVVMQCEPCACDMSHVSFHLRRYQPRLMHVHVQSGPMRRRAHRHNWVVPTLLCPVLSTQRRPHNRS